MRSLYLLLFFIFPISSFASKAETKELLNKEVTQLRQQINDAQISLKSASYAISKLKAELADTISWGVDQEKEKTRLYAENIELKKQIAQFDEKLEHTRKEIVKFEVKYKTTKSVLAYVGGVLLLLAYLLLGGSLLSKILNFVASPWGTLLQFAAPFIAFAIGYFGIQFYF